MRLTAGSVLPPDSAFAPLFALFLAFVCSAHRSPCKPERVTCVFCRAVNSLLVNEVNVVQSRRPVSEHLKQDRFSHELQCGSDSIIARIKNVADPVLFEFAPAQLE